MGAIQQAFNQSLGVLALAASPLAKEKVGIAGAEKEAKKAAKEVYGGTYDLTSEAVKTPEGKWELSTTKFEGSPTEAIQQEGLANPSQPKLVMERGLSTAEEAYRRNPSKANLIRLESMREEQASFSSARSMQKKQAQYRDQSENIKKVKQMQETVRQARYKIKGKETQ